MIAIQQIIIDAESTTTSAATPKSKRRRRGQALVEFKRAIKAELRAGKSVADVAERFGVTRAYIYMLR